MVQVRCTLKQLKNVQHKPHCSINEPVEGVRRQDMKDKYQYVLYSGDVSYTKFEIFSMLFH